MALSRSARGGRPAAEHYRGLCSKSSVVLKRLKEEEKIGRNPSSESIIDNSILSPPTFELVGFLVYYW